MSREPQILHLYRSANLFICSQLSCPKNSSTDNAPLELRRCYRAPIYGYIVTLSSPNDAISRYSARTPAIYRATHPRSHRADRTGHVNIHSIHVQGSIALHRLFLSILTATKTRTRSPYFSSTFYLHPTATLLYSTCLPKYLPR